MQIVHKFTAAAGDWRARTRVVARVGVDGALSIGTGSVVSCSAIIGVKHLISGVIKWPSVPRLVGPSGPIMLMKVPKSFATSSCTKLAASQSVWLNASQATASGLVPISVPNRSTRFVGSSLPCSPVNKFATTAIQASVSSPFVPVAASGAKTQPVGSSR